MVRLRVKEIAKQKGISMGKLSRASDISYRTVQRIYNDPAYTPTIHTPLCYLVGIVPDLTAW